MVKWLNGYIDNVKINSMFFNNNSTIITIYQSRFIKNEHRKK